MIIVSQDKTEIINFDNVNTLRATKTGFIVSYENTYKAEYDCSNILGKYKTEERAKEVLQEIMSAFSDFEYFKSTEESNKENIGIKIFANYGIIDVYKMPED